MASYISKSSSKVGADNHAKGIVLEELFCEFMKTDLGYHRARTRAQVVSDSNSRGTNVDVIGLVRNEKYEMMKKMSYILYAAGIMYVFLIAYSYYVGSPSTITIAIFFSFMLIFCILSMYCISTYRNHIEEHAWAECKNQQESISTELMQLAIMRLQSYERTKNKEYNFTKQYFVATSSFSEGALKLAQDKKIICYKLESGNFVEVTYW